MCIRARHSPTEVPDHERLRGIWRPLSVYDVPIGLYVEPVFLIPARELLEATLGVVDRLNPLLGGRVATLEGVPERFKPRVELDDS